MNRMWEETRNRLRPAAALALAVAAALLAGCAGAPPPQEDYALAWEFQADADSLGLDDFASLAPAERSERREMAAAWRERARSESRACGRMQALGTSAGLAPDDPELWLKMAELARAVGDRRRALHCVDAAEGAVAWADPSNWIPLRLKIAQQRAWIYKDDGRWLEAMAWADSSARISHDERETRMLQGLTRAGGGNYRGALLEARDIQRLDPKWFEWRWIHALAELVQGRPDVAYHWLTSLTESEAALARSVPRDLLRVNLSPDPIWAAAFNQDAGRVCENLGRYDRAATYYRRAADSLPIRDDHCLVRRDVTVRPEMGKPYRLPVWLAFDRHFAAGSPYAWALEALRRFNAADAPVSGADTSRGGGRAVLADAASEALSLCIRMDLHPDWARARRGHVYAVLEVWDLAERDLRAAQAAFEDRGVEDAWTMAWLGRIETRADRTGRARRLLERAVRSDPSLAGAWSDLGYVLLRQGAPDEGLRALDRALAIDPQMAAAWYNRGLLHYRQKDWPAAVADLDRALELAPGNEEIIILYQQARLQLKRESAGAAQSDEPAP